MVFFRLDPLHANESILTLPEELATNQLQPFVDWPCRQLFFDPTPEVCSDAEASAFATCAVAYPDLVAHACREHLADEKQQEAKRRLLQWSLPVALIAAIMILACAVIAAHRWRRNLLIGSLIIPFEELHFIAFDGSHATTTTFNALGILSSTARESSLKYAEWRGSKVVVRLIGAGSAGRSAGEVAGSIKTWTRRLTAQHMVRSTSFMSILNKDETMSNPGSPRVMAMCAQSNTQTSSSPCSSNRTDPKIGINDRYPPTTPIAPMGTTSPRTPRVEASPYDGAHDTVINMPTTAWSAARRSGRKERMSTANVCSKQVYLPGNIEAATSLRHPNLVAVLGVSVDKPTGNRYVVMEPMALGSLHNVLQDELLLAVNDVPTVVHILMNVVAGIRYLHGAKEPFVHCDIRAKNILLDEQLTAKVRTDIMPNQALPQHPSKVGGIMRNKQHESSAARKVMSEPAASGPFVLPKFTAWTAPEVLCGQPPTCKSDVYALGVTMWEALSRESPYAEDGCSDPMSLSPKLVDGIVARGQRPTIPSSVPSELREIIVKCWRQDPLERPDLDEVAADLSSVQASKPMKPLGAAEELKQSRHLLHQMLPPHIAEALQEGRKVEPEFFNEVTIFFSDIIGYTDISSTMEPTKVMAMLDRLYQEFDSLTRTFGLFKVETIGDAYMCVGGLPEAQGDHAVRVARFALEAVRAANSVPVDLDNPEAGFVQIRAGFHSGPVVASVVGDLNPRYCLFGDTVNTAARMESNSRRNKINLSISSRRAVEAQAPRGFHFAQRGIIDVKGKGPMECFFLLGEAPEARIRARSAKSFSFDQTVSKCKQRSSSCSDLLVKCEVDESDDEDLLS